LVRFQIALGVIDGDRPETVDGDLLDRELVDGDAVIPGRRDRKVEGVPLGKAAPNQRGSNEVTHRIDLMLGGAEHGCLTMAISAPRSRKRN
jgi:hypothetical protein